MTAIDRLLTYNDFVSKYGKRPPDIVFAVTRLDTLQAVGQWLANLTVSGNAVANELRIVEGLAKLMRGEMPE